MRRVTWISTFTLLLASDFASGQSIDAYNPLPEVPPESITTQADGKILIVGNFAEVGTTTQHGVARLNVDGSASIVVTRRSTRLVHRIRSTPAR